MSELPEPIATAALRPGDRLLDTAGLVIAGPPGTVVTDGTVLVPVEGDPNPVPFAVTAAWRVDRPDTQPAP